VEGENLRRWFPAYREPPPDERSLDQYLQRNYAQIGVRNGFRVLRRIDADGAQSAALSDERR
jgi:hypothetical protein